MEVVRPHRPAVFGREALCRASLAASGGLLRATRAGAGKPHIRDDPAEVFRLPRNCPGGACPTERPGSELAANARRQPRKGFGSGSSKSLAANLWTTSGSLPTEPRSCMSQRMAELFLCTTARPVSRAFCLSANWVEDDGLVEVPLVVRLEEHLYGLCPQGAGTLSRGIDVQTGPSAVSSITTLDPILFRSVVSGRDTRSCARPCSAIPRSSRWRSSGPTSRSSVGCRFPSKPVRLEYASDGSHRNQGGLQLRRSESPGLCCAP